MRLNYFIAKLAMMMFLEREMENDSMGDAGVINNN